MAALDLPMLDEALAYARRGWVVSPVHSAVDGRCSCGRKDCDSPGKHPRTAHGLKDATTDEGQIRAWWKRWPKANIAVATGERSGLVVLDVDPPIGEETLDALVAEHGQLPSTLTAITGRDGRHFLFAHPGEEVANTAGKKLGPGLDVRGDGGYIVVAPSLHATGRRYEWIDLDVVPAPMPAWMLDRLRKQAPAAPAAVYGPPPPRAPGTSGTAYGLKALDAELDGMRSTGEGGRNAALNRAAFALGQLVAGGELDEGAVVAELSATAAAMGLGEREITATLSSGLASGKEQPRRAPERPDRSVAAKSRHLKPVEGTRDPDAGDPGPTEPPDEDYEAPVGPDGYRQSDRGNARRLVERYGADLRYCGGPGWLVWDGQRWAPDETGEIFRRAKSAVEGMLAELDQVGGDDDRKRLFKWILTSESQNRLEAMVRCAQSEAEIPVNVRDLDANPWALNCRNGTVDLRTGKLRPHRREDLITKVAPVDYDADAPAPVFEAFLDQIMGGDAETSGFLQRAVGYSLSGRVSEQVLFFLHGSGANGKSTLMSALMDILGDYARTTERDLLIARRGEVHPTGVADLCGVRLALAEEVEAGRRFDEGLVKQLTGGDRIKARYMRQDFFEFAPTHKLWLAANHKPVVRGTDHAIWRRLRLIPFGVTIAAENQDRNLVEKLAAEGPGILAWAVRGCLAWQKEGLGQPAAVAAATSEYRAEMDVLGSFLADCCDVDGTLSIAASELYRSYTDWCRASNEYAQSQKIFGGLLTERGFRRQQFGRNKTWTWLGLGPSGAPRPFAALSSDEAADSTPAAKSPEMGRDPEIGGARPFAALRGPDPGSPLRVGADGDSLQNKGRDGPHGPRPVEATTGSGQWEIFQEAIGVCAVCDFECRSRDPQGVVRHQGCDPEAEI